MRLDGDGNQAAPSTERHRLSRKRMRAAIAGAAAVGLFVFVGATAWAVASRAQEVLVDLPASEGPELAWSQIGELPVRELRDAVWTGERFIVSGSNDPRDGRTQAWSSVDGSEWEPISRLDALAAQYGQFELWANDGTVLAWSWSGADHRFFDGELLRSDDDGQTFEPVPGMAEGVRQLPDVPDQTLAVHGALLVGDTVLLPVMRNVGSASAPLEEDLDEERRALLAASGLSSVIVSHSGGAFEVVDLGAFLLNWEQPPTITPDGRFAITGYFHPDAPQNIPARPGLPDAVGLNRRGFTKAVVTSADGVDWEVELTMRSEVDVVGLTDDGTVARQNKLIMHRPHGVDEWQSSTIHPGLYHFDTGPGGFFGSANTESSGLLGRIASPTPVYGWSPDGVDWNWQQVDDQFDLDDQTEANIDKGRIPMRFIVGDHTALAIPNTDTVNRRQVFVADLPDREP